MNRAQTATLIGDWDGRYTIPGDWKPAIELEDDGKDPNCTRLHGHRQLVISLLAVQTRLDGQSYLTRHLAFIDSLIEFSRGSDERLRHLADFITNYGGGE